MLTARAGLALAIILMISADRATSATVLSFEDLKSFEQVGAYYNGGKGSKGSGPGPMYGVTFSTPYAVAFIPTTPYPNDPSPPTVLLLADPSGNTPTGSPLSMTMDVSGGFAGELGYYYLAIGSTASSVAIYSGLDGTGKQLAMKALELGNQAVFSNLIELKFAGTARSVVFKGGNDQLAFDNISFQSVPEPGSALLMALGFLSVFFVHSARHLMASASCQAASTAGSTTEGSASGVQLASPLLSGLWDDDMRNPPKSTSPDSSYCAL
jgi:hypothetical protein